MKYCTRCGGSGYLLRLKDVHIKFAFKRCTNCDEGIRGRARQKHGRHGSEDLFNDKNWYRLSAPVVPPQSVVAKVLKTQSPVDWQNGENRVWDASIPGTEKNWLMLYRTEIENKKIVTRLLPGSAQPVRGWLGRRGQRGYS